MQEESEHQGHMREALALAARARGRTSPNPMVGAVLVKDGQVVGRGLHPRAGQPHAEVFALREAGQRARGATLYVTLEPCCHHGRTPPCAPAVVEAGVGRVFAAMEDPNPLVAGQGLRALRASGIETRVGLLEDEARQLNEAYVKRIATGRPFVEVKVAMTLDGKTATSSGRSRWITGEAAREWVHRRRDAADAVLVGAGTVRADDPALTVRLPDHDGRQPLRVVVSASGRLDPRAQVFHGPPPGTVVFCATDDGTGNRQQATGNREQATGYGQQATGNGQQATGNGGLFAADVAVRPRLGAHLGVGRSSGAARRAGLKPAPTEMGTGVELVSLPGSDGGVDLPQMLRWLAKRGINDVLVEGGAKLNAALLRAGLVDRLSVFVAPKLFGGAEAPGGFGELGVEDPALALQLQHVEVTQVGVDWLFRGGFGK
ncbi:MAG: bifunctional diaminohydroxyphosphoribosylaminopyrimidine deaminase/5-amino-6-(5-phosphoribosylamino)uracil reductase RibD [Chloroflexota bacterium]|nr:bifunctional diaminohydroxyphosphoribosylaminopyrimidine deaminase/5-amino-6-(5-phosphoribosylamino)uracil reductase RibD [Chloroflexota bacterium]